MIPAPLSVEASSGSYALDAGTGVHGSFPAVAAWLRAVLSRATGHALTGTAGIELRRRDGLGPEEYLLDVAQEGVLIEASEEAGAFYGAQTLRQLLDPDAFRAAPVRQGEWTVPAVTVADRPAFGWRGLLIDVARHFLPKNDLLRYVDLMAVHKLNVLHLHLTDDQGWRVEIKRYPRLTEVGAWRRESPVGAVVHGVFDGQPHGGYYTQDDLREIVAYAAARHITVVPEIDLPGHTQAAIAAYPSLGNLSETLEVGTTWGIGSNVLNVADETIAFFKNVLDEVLDIFPGEYVGVGGDECPKTQWNDSVQAKERMRDLGLESAEELQTWFVRQFTDHLLARGRKPYGWDELLEGGVPPGTTVAAWRGELCATLAVKAGHDVVVSPFDRLYLDFRQADGLDEPVPIGSVTTLREVHAFDPVPAGLDEDERRRIVGASAALWTEHIDSPRLLDYMAFPRLSAFAEAVWSGARDFGEFADRLAVHERRLAALGVEFRPASGPHPWQRRPDAPGNPRTSAEIGRKLAGWTANLSRRT